MGMVGNGRLLGVCGVQMDCEIGGELKWTIKGIIWVSRMEVYFDFWLEF